MPDHPAAPEPDTPPPDGRDSDRLDSWKEIAVYLNRGVSTVQRWERDQGLPVCRFKSSANQGSVFAYRSEIDEWLEGQKQTQQAAPSEPRAKSWTALPWAVTAFALTLVALGAWIGNRLTRQPPASAVNLRPELVREYSLDSPLAAVSPDGEQVAYIDLETREIRLRNRTGSQERTLGERGVGRLVWSSDGRRLAADTRPAVGKGRQVVVFDLPAGDSKVIWQGKDPHPPLPSDFTPDSDSVVCLVDEPDHTRRVITISLEDGLVSRLALAPEFTEDPRLSPDSRYLAYWACPERNCEVFVVSVQGGAPVSIAPSPAWEGVPRWTPDGGRILFLSERLGEGRADLWSVAFDPATGRPEREPSLVFDLTAPVSDWTLGDRGRLFFRQDSPRSRVFLLDIDPATGLAQGAPESPFAAGTSAPTWLADGARLAIVDNSRGTQIRDFTGALRETVDGPVDGLTSRRLIPAPYGRRYAFYTFAAGGGRGVFVFDPDAGETRQIHQFDGFLGPPLTWSPDGTRLLFAVTRRTEGGLVQEITAAAADGDDSIILARTTGRPPYAIWSPDGRQAAFTDGNCIFAVSADPGLEAEQPRRITCAPSSDATDPVDGVGPMGQLGWSPDGDKLAWIVHNPGKQTIQLRIVDYATGMQSVSWESAPGYEHWPYSPRWSSAGNRIAFEMRYRRRWEIWSLTGVSLAPS